MDIERIIEGAEANDEAGEEVDREGELKDSELKDYGYEPESESDEDSDNEEGEDSEAGEDDDTIIDELADY